MQFTLTVNTDGAAFEVPAQEIARILEDVKAQVDQTGIVPGEVIRIRDTNGNRVGFASLEEPATSYTLAEVRNGTGWARGVRFAVVPS